MALSAGFLREFGNPPTRIRHGDDRSGYPFAQSRRPSCLLSARGRYSSGTASRSYGGTQPADKAHGPSGPNSVEAASWLIRRDVNEGRAVLNFSEWQRRQEKASDAADEVLEREMPPLTYRLMHAHARLSAADRDRLAGGLVQSLGVSREETDGDHR
jgi:Haem-binding domain